MNWQLRCLFALLAKLFTIDAAPPERWEGVGVDGVIYISSSFCRPIMISATLVMFDFCIFSLCVIFKHWTGIKNNRWVLSFICLFICMWIVDILPFIYLLFDCLFGYVCYLFILFVCLFSLLFSFRWFPFPFVFTANNDRCYFIFIYFIVNVRWEVRRVNGLMNWWSNMSWAGGWVWQQVISHHNDGKKSCSKLSLYNCKTLMIKQ